MLNIFPLLIFKANFACQSCEASKLLHHFARALHCVYQLPQLRFPSSFLPQDSLQKPRLRNDCQVYFYRFLKFTFRTVLQLQEKAKEPDNERHKTIEYKSLIFFTINHFWNKDLSWRMRYSIEETGVFVCLTGKPPQKTLLHYNFRINK